MDLRYFTALIFMKKLRACLIVALMLAFLMPASVFAASDASVDKVDFSAELRSNGNALITENWTVTFNGKADSFVREIVIPEDNFEKFSQIYDLSVSIDGNGCSEVAGDSAVNGTYSVEKKEDRYIIRCFIQSENETRTFSLRYVQSGVVKIYNNKAYFYSTVSNADSNLLCRNVTVTVRTPKKCFAEDFSIVESGSLIGQKSDGKVVFNAVNAVGLIKTGISMPADVFDTSVLAVIVDDNTVEIVILVALFVIVAAAAGFGIFYTLNYRKLFRLRWEKKCRKTAHSESSYKMLNSIQNTLSPARILFIVSEKTLSGADLFVVTFLDLMERGYIQASPEGFAISQTSQVDSVGRSIDKAEQIVLDFFGTEKWKKTVTRPKRFYYVVEKFNRKVRFVSPFYEFTPEGKKIAGRCFELKLSASRYEFIFPEEISDDIFRSGKYTAFDLIISLLNEYALSLNSELEKTGVEKFKRNMFMLRDAYEEGKSIVMQEELERNEQKKLKKKNLVIDDDIDSQ